MCSGTGFDEAFKIHLPYIGSLDPQGSPMRPEYSFPEATECEGVKSRKQGQLSQGHYDGVSAAHPLTVHGSCRFPTLCFVLV